MKKQLLALTICTLLLAFFDLGSVPLFDVDEAVFSQASKEMVQNDEWITPTYNGANRYDKPIFFYWLMILSYKMFGVSEFGARFPSAVTAILLALTLFMMTRKVTSDDNIAFYAAAAFIFSLYFFAYSHAAVVDMTLALFISLSLLCFYCYIHESSVSKDRARGYHYAFHVFSAIAFLTKGLIGIIFPFGIAAVYMLITEGVKGVRKIFSLKGSLLFLMTGAPWYLAQLAINGQEFIDQFFIKHHFKRYAEANSGHSGGFYYYIPVLAAGIFPWIAFLPAGIKTALKKTDRFALFALVWFAFVFIFFSVSSTKLPNYIFPAVPAAAILAAYGIRSAAGRKKFEYIFTFVSAAAIGIIFIILPKYIPKILAADISWTYGIAAVMLGLSAYTLYAFFKNKEATVQIAVLSGAFIVIIAANALPLASKHLQGTLHTYSIYAKEKTASEQKIIAYNINKPSIVFYSDRMVAQIGDAKNLYSFLQDKKNALAITGSKNRAIMEEAGLRLIRDDGQYALFEK
ncbi:MAG: glycosyltransferase family 39 protein [Nitrospirae bacterium]|nr:glycosyltransferase family 39 protein [Nitrospirota bacterium]